ncbi:hypothetical protein GCM10027040_35160 [Halomonas shantousis]
MPGIVAHRLGVSLPQLLGYTCRPFIMQYCEAFVTENVNINRLYWHSRRGMWELDLLLVPFLEHRYRELSSQDQALYRTLIDNEDQDLFVWLMRREWPEDDGLRRIVKMIVEYAETTSNDQYRTL